MKINKNDPHVRLAVLDAFDAFKLERRVQPIHLNDVFDLDLEMRHSSPGIPWQPMFKTRGDVMDDSAARNSIRWYWHNIKNNYRVSTPDCKVLYRAHLEEDFQAKIRAVYGYPTTVTLAEAQFALPLIDAFTEQETPIAYKFDMCCGGAMKVRRALGKYRNFACLDFRKFDKSVPADLIYIAFEILQQNIDFGHYYCHGVPDAERLLRVWDFLVDYFVNTPLRLPTGERFKKQAGVPSGSYFTQLIDSIVNYIVLKYAMYKSRINGWLKVFGDDSIIGSNEEFQLIKLAQCVLDFGMELNVRKSLVTQNLHEVEFLGFTLTNGFPQRTTIRWLASLYNPERPDEEPDLFFSRVLGLFYANHGVNLEFDNICRKLLHYIPFDIKYSTNFRRFLQQMGLDYKRLGPDLPDQTRMLFALIG